MAQADVVLIVGAMLNLLWGYGTGYFFAVERERRAQAPRYLVMAHVGPFIQGGMLFGLVFAVRFSTLPAAVETAAACGLVGSSLLIAAKDTINWRLGVEDEFRQRPNLPRRLGVAGVVVGLLGFATLFAGVIGALM